MSTWANKVGHKKSFSCCYGQSAEIVKIHLFNFPPPAVLCKLSFLLLSISQINAHTFQRQSRQQHLLLTMAKSFAIRFAFWPTSFFWPDGQATKIDLQYRYFNHQSSWLLVLSYMPCYSPPEKSNLWAKSKEREESAPKTKFMATIWAFWAVGVKWRRGSLLTKFLVLFLCE